MISERKKVSKLIFDIFWLFLLNGFSLYLIFSSQNAGYSDWIYSFIVFSVPILINLGLLIYIHDIFETEEEYIDKVKEIYSLNTEVATSKARIFTWTMRIGKICILITLAIIVLIFFLGFKLSTNNINTFNTWVFIIGYSILLIISCFDKLFHYFYPKSFKQKNREDEVK